MLRRNFLWLHYSPSSGVRNDTVLWLRFSFFYYGWTWYVILEYVFFVQNSKQGVRCHNVADGERVKQPFVRQIAFMYLNTLVVDENLQMHLHICTTTFPFKLYIFGNTTALSFLWESNAIPREK